MRVLCLIGLVMSPLCALATIWTVSNSPSQPAQFADIPSAISAASSGDTLYIHGSSAQYFSGSYSLDKPLVLIGPGKNPQSNDSQLAILGGPGGSGGSILLQTGADGSQIIGLRLTGAITDQGGVNNILIQGCVVQRSVNGNSSTGSANWVLRDNIIRLDNGTVNPYAISPGLSSTGWVVENNVVGGRLYNSAGQTYRHNVFIQNQSGFGDVFANGNTNNLLEDNIFYGVGPQGCGTCTFNYNLTFGATNNTLPAGSSGTGNIIDQNPQFVDATLTAVNTQWQMNDFHLLPGSPAVGMGSSSDDIGLFGSPSASVSGNTLLPVIKSISVDNPTVPAGGVIQIEVTATRPENP